MENIFKLGSLSNYKDVKGYHIMMKILSFAGVLLNLTLVFV